MQNHFLSCSLGRVVCVDFLCVFTTQSAKRRSLEHPESGIVRIYARFSWYKVRLK